MTMMRNTVPASLRRPPEMTGTSRSLMARSTHPTVAPGVESQALTMAKGRFAPLPEEPEDARMTGVTRSLNRRLLALNVPGSLRMSMDETPDPKIA